MKLNQSLLQSLSTLLRALSMIMRFIFLLYIANRLTPGEVGMFGLYSAALAWVGSLLVFDVYASTTREILKDINARKESIQAHMGFLLAVIFFIVVLWIVSLKFNLTIDQKLYAIFVLHLAFEIFSLDMTRLMVPLGKIIDANLILFLRNAGWMISVMIFFEIFPSLRRIEFILINWMIASITSSVLIYYLLSKFFTYEKLIPILNWPWIRRSINASIFIFGGTILFRFVTNYDRVIVEQHLGIDSVGIYTVYVGISFGLISLMEVGVSFWHYGPMVKDIQADDKLMAREKYKKFWLQNILSAIVLTTIIIVIFPIVANYVLPSIYLSDLSLFYILMLGTFFYVMSLPDHYWIYGHGKDLASLTIYGISAVVMVLTGYILIPTLGLTGAGAAMLFALASISFIRISYSFFMLRIKQAT